MIVLAFDCSTTGCAAAVTDDARVLARGEAPMGSGQSEALMPLLHRVMDEAGVVWPSLGLIGVTVGPGSFTGLRIGLAAARGLALALNVPVAGVGTAEALAAGVPVSERGQRTILVAIESKRTEPFVQLFAPDLTQLGPIAAIEPSAVAKLVTAPPLLVGDAAARILSFAPGAIMSAAPIRPDPTTVAALAAARHGEGRALPPEPLYLRPADVTLPGGLA